MKRLIVSVLGLMFVSLSFVGCASITPASQTLDAKAKEFSVDPDRASLYIFRDESFGGMVPKTVSLNGRVLGRTGPHSYFWVRVRPGTYNIESQVDDFVLPLKAEAGKIYYIWQEMKMGALVAGSKLHLVDEKRGREGVLGSTMIAVGTGAPQRPAPDTQP